MEIHSLADEIKPGKLYVEFLRTAHLTAGVYRLPKGGTDAQQPHREEEIYFVTAGRALFTSGSQTAAVKPGDVLYVPALEPHRFHAIEEDLELLVFFAPPESTS